MAHAEELPSDIRTSIARQIGARLPKLSNATPGGPPDASEKSVKAFEEMYVSYPIYTFDARAFSETIRDVARHTGRWHHQFRRVTSMSSGPAQVSVLGSAVSRVFGPSPTDWNIVSVAGATPASASGPDVDLTSEIDGAGDWIDKYVHDNPLVRLLALPSLFVYAFWLVYPEHDCVVIIDMPVAFEAIHGGPFEYRVVYDSSTFLTGLRRAKPVRGLEY